MFGMFYVVFFLIFGMCIFMFVRSIHEWSRNNRSPRLSVDARIVDKRMETHHHHTNGHHHHTHTYRVTFEVQSGDRMELTVSGSEYGFLVVGDEGTLSFQGTRYLGFERKP